jgi:hypothetical protein
VEAVSGIDIVEPTAEPVAEPIADELESEQQQLSVIAPESVNIDSEVTGFSYEPMALEINAATQQQAVDWCRSKFGTFVEYSDSSYMYQCFDFISAYANAVLGYKKLRAGRFICEKFD